MLAVRASGRRREQLAFVEKSTGAISQCAAVPYGKQAAGQLDRPDRIGAVEKNGAVVERQAVGKGQLNRRRIR